jgi:Flp pilus assembly protein CpaB
VAAPVLLRYRHRLDEVNGPVEQVAVVVAARALYPGVPIGEGDVYVVLMEPRFLQPGMFLSPELVIGRMPAERILGNEVVRGERLSDPENGRGLNAVIPRGMRAISVEVGGSEALAGLLRPGSYVDLLVTVRPDDSVEGGEHYAPGGTRQEAVTQTLAQGVFVFAVNGTLQGEQAERRRDPHATVGNPSVTLMVPPDLAESVAHFDELGEFTLTLRNDQDDQAASLRRAGVDVDGLRALFAGPTLPRSSAPRPAAPAPALPGSELLIIRGGETTIETVGPDGGISSRERRR